MKVSFENSNINFYFSFQCPYSYLAWIQLSKILKDNNKVSLKPINVGIEPIGNNRYSYRDLWGGERWLRLSNEARKFGVSLSKPVKIVSENLTSRSLEYFGPSGAEYYISSIFKAVFSSNLDISITSTLRYFLQSEGNDSELIVKACEDDNSLVKAKANIDLWCKKRIRLLPTIEIGSERIAGFINNKQIEDLLRLIIDMP